MDARYVSAKVIEAVINHRMYLDHALTENLTHTKDPREAALARELSYGIIRWYPRLIFITNLLLQKPLKARDTDVLALLCSGLYQLGYMRIPDHAAISATVETARALGKEWACQLLNAVLRRYQRERDAIERQILESEPARFAHPKWLIARLRDAWPDHWEQILLSNNEHPPMQLRVNLQRHTRPEYISLLGQAGIEAAATPLASTGITLSTGTNVEQIPGFYKGQASVQDIGAQLAAELLDARAGERVLDACAAPGGKTGHILERTPGLQKLIAVDSEPGRIELLRDNMRRIGLQADLLCADLRETGAWWDGVAFDRILLDAPCSATGVIRRNPDIKLLRKPEHLPLFTNTQSALLECVWPLLKPGGRLLYSTCSILPEESDDQIASFANKYDDTRIIPIDMAWGVASAHGRYILPGQEQSDGFYYALMTKITGE
jgi:16S rRNA (cytosine967-C5)-methyltransferase